MIECLLSKVMSSPVPNYFVQPQSWSPLWTRGFGGYVSRGFAGKTCGGLEYKDRKAKSWLYVNWGPFHLKFSPQDVDHKADGVEDRIDEVCTRVLQRPLQAISA